MAPGPPIPLPLEVLAQVFSPLPQHALYACTLTSRSWYSAAIAFLYDHPRITGKNFDVFVTAVCPSINAHIRHNGLAELVRTLDMSSLVHNGRKSLTARLLGRLKGNLEVFVAPQATFALVIPFPLNIMIVKPPIFHRVMSESSEYCLIVSSVTESTPSLPSQNASVSIP